MNSHSVSWPSELGFIYPFFCVTCHSPSFYYRPGDQNYSRLSVNTSLVADVMSVVKVGKNHFLPPPKVDSRVIKLVPLATPLFPATDDRKQLLQRFDSFLRVCFLRKNKTLRALLTSRSAHVEMQIDATKQQQSSTTDPKEFLKTQAQQALDACDLASKRAVQLPAQEFLRYLL